MTQVEFVPSSKLPYKTVTDVDGKPSKLMVYAFQQEGDFDAPRPAIVYFFGGGWVKGQPQAFFANAAHFAKLGFIGISADYRTEERHGTTPFECVKDGRSVMRWLKANAGELGIDPERIIAAGSSAGGHVAACTVLPDGELVDEASDDLSISPVPAAMVLLNPATDTGDGAAGRIPGDGHAISPVHHVRPGLPPTLVLHSRDDELIPFAMAEAYVQAMQDAGNRCELEAYSGYGHGFHYFGKGDNPAYGLTIARTEQFLQDLMLL